MTVDNASKRFLAGAVLSLTLLFSSFSATSSAETPTATVQQASSDRAFAPPVRIAEDIMRRLRHLGLNFNRNRIPRPYDPDGELC